MAAVVAVGFGGWAIAAGLRERGDIRAGLVAGVAVGVAIRLARPGPTAARVRGILLAVAGLGVAYPVIVDTDMDWWLAMLPGALLLLALLPDDRPAQ